MSGGSYNYFCFKLEEFADDIAHQDSNPRRKAFAAVMKKAAKVAHEIEWADSGDTLSREADRAIDKFFTSLKLDAITVGKATAFDMIQSMINKVDAAAKTSKKEK